MTLIELARKVREMRDAQKTYFRDRTPATLGPAKEQERQVDALCKEILEGHPAMLPGFGER